MGNRKKNPAWGFMCGVCKEPFGSRNAVEMHARNKHQGRYVSIWAKTTGIDLRDEPEPSFADRAIEAQIALASGLPTDDAWLLGE